MAVTYTREQRETAKRDGLRLVTVATEGVEFQGPVSADEHKRLTEYIIDFLRRRAEWLKTLPPE